MAGGNQYKCPNCDFVGRLGQLTRHLRENPEHWMVHCQECGVSIVTKKDIARHEEDTGHSTGLTPEDIINVQRTTKISGKKTVKSATKPAKKKVKSATKRKRWRWVSARRMQHCLPQVGTLRDKKSKSARFRQDPRR